MSLNACIDVVELVCSNLYTNFFLYLKICARISKISCMNFFCFILCTNSYTNSCTNLYANSYVNLVREIHTKFIIFGRTKEKVHTNS